MCKRLLLPVLLEAQWASGGIGPCCPPAGWLDTELLTGTVHLEDMGGQACGGGLGRAGRRLPGVCLSPKTPPRTKRLFLCSLAVTEKEVQQW